MRLKRSHWIAALVLAQWVVCVLSVCLITYGCGSGSNPSPDPISDTGQNPAQVIVETDQQLSTAPHLFDVYRATNADKAIIFLHGYGVNKHHAAYQFGINLSDIDTDYGTVNEEILLTKKVMAIFPQGQAVSTSPEAYTWSNYVTTSGQDDMKFIHDLVGFISAQYGITRFFIVGHSTGAMLVNRIWCESPNLFDSYVGVSGPPSEHFLDPLTLCSPAEAKPYLGIVHSEDAVLGVQQSNWDAPTWTINESLMLPPADEEFIDPVVIGERYFLSTRVAKRCGEAVEDGDASATTVGSVTAWSFCENSIRLLRVDSNYDLAALQKAVWQFLPSQ
jgi:polyhydroxybutyrate depolymerase